MNHKTSVTVLVALAPKVFLASMIALVSVALKSWPMPMPFPMSSTSFETSVTEIDAVEAVDEVESSQTSGAVQAPVPAVAEIKVSSPSAWEDERVALLQDVKMPNDIMSEAQFDQALLAYAAQGSWREFDQHLRLGYPGKKVVGKALALALASRNLQKVRSILSLGFVYSEQSGLQGWQVLANEVQVAMDQDQQWQLSGLLETAAIMQKVVPHSSKFELASLMKKRGPAQIENKQ